jgi:hypothetical protein
MSIRFAGSRGVDDLRRRRLAQEADSSSESSVRTKSSSAADDGAVKLPRGSSPADTLISPRLWKHAAVAAMAFLAWATVIFFGDRADQTQNGLEAIVGLAAGKLTTFFSTVMLLTAGQLSFITLWYRSRSRKDFSGSFKLWFYTAVGWLTLCAFQATGAHWNLADAALAGRPFAIWNGRLILWLIPTAIVVVTLYRLLLREMRDCTLSLWTLRLSGLAAFGAGLAVMFGHLALTSRVALVAASAAATLWHLLLAVSMLLHARHVIHETNEPPQRPLSRWRLRIPRLALPQRRASTPKAGATTRSKPKPKTKRASTSRKTAEKPARSTPVVDDLSEAEEDDAADEESPVFEAPETPPKVESRPVLPPGPVAKATSSPASAPIRRVDPPQPGAKAKPHFVVPAATSQVEESSEAGWSDDDAEDEDDSTGGLSKKERKRLKKLARQRV